MRIKEKTQNLLRQYWSLAVLFLLAFALFRAVPPFGDLLANAGVYQSSGGIWQWILRVLNSVSTSNGRVSCTFISGIVEADASGALWDVFSAFLIVAIVYFIHKIFHPKRLYFLSMAAAGLIFMVSAIMRDSTLFYAVTTYVFPIPAVLCFLYLLSRYEADRKSKGMVVSLCAMAFVCATIIENVTLPFMGCLGIYLLWKLARIREKDWRLWIVFGVGAVGTAIVFLSAGMHVQRSVIDTQVDMLHTIVANFKTSMNFLLCDNIPMFAAVFVILLLFVLSKKGVPLRKRAALLALLSVCEISLLYLSFSTELLANASFKALALYAALLMSGVVWTISLCEKRRILLFLLGMSAFSLIVCCPWRREIFRRVLYPSAISFLQCLERVFFARFSLKRQLCAGLRLYLRQGCSSPWPTECCFLGNV